MMQQSEKYKTLQTLKEDEFRTDVIIPLLKKMGLQQVRERHGTQEYGKDITYCIANPLGDIYGAVVAKVGQITGSATGKQNLDAVLSQVGMAFNVPVDDVEQQRKYPIQEVIVWTSGHIANNAERRILESAREHRNIRFFSGQKTVELLEQYYPAFFTIRDPYIAEYYSAAKEFYSRLEELRTLGGSPEQRPLPSMFVPPTLVEFDGRRRKNLRPNNVKTPRQEYTFEQIIDSSDDLFVFGEFGAGKSTLLRRILLAVIAQNEQMARKSPIPILVPFKKIDFLIPDGLEQATTREFSRFGGTKFDSVSPLDFDDGSVIVLLDSVDELKSNDLMRQALQMVAEFKQKHKKTRVIATSRFIESAQGLNILAGFRILEIQNLTPGQMVKFIQKWYGSDDRFTAKMIQLIQSPLALQGLPTTPLTLALVATIYEHDNKEIPANITDLFQKYIELALGRWDSSKEVSLLFEWRVKQFLLQKVGWYMHESTSLSMMSENLHQLLEQISHQRGLGLDPEAFCQEVSARSELLILNEDGDYEFKHRSFKDFFAGMELGTRSDALDLAAVHVNDMWWAQTIFFASSMDPSNHAYIDVLRKRAPGRGVGRLLSGYQMGHLLQGAYLARRDVKKEAVLYVLDEFIVAWNAFAEAMRQKEDTSVPFALMHADLVVVFGALGQMALGSVTLSPILTEVTNQLLSNPPGESVYAKAKHEWQMFLIASACLRSGNINDFKRIFESPLLQEPSFHLAASISIQGIISESWISKEEQDQLEKILDKWEKRWSGLTEYRKNLANILPVPLPPDPQALPSAETPLLPSGKDDSESSER